VRIENVHERRLDARPDAVAALLDDVDRLWPAPEPVREGNRLRAFFMEWEQSRDDGRLVFRIKNPPEFAAEHWFEVAETSDGAILRHTLAGEATGWVAKRWPEEIRPGHDAYIEALLDRVEEALHGR
jgi:hypothetical protein